ncbi:MAG: RtcB family protein, partial [Planctomycetales bacterium]|nr:RtcB family protein [Planctomycetales bacterium]
MNSRQLEKLGVPKHCAKLAITGVQSAVKAGEIGGKEVKDHIRKIVETPNLFLGDAHFGPFAKELIDDATENDYEPITYRTWGNAGIDKGSHDQMKNACELPCAVAAALMPDAHIGYGLPIGGVLATDNAVIPYAVGVDIACRMKMSIIDMPANTLDSKFEQFRESLEGGTLFGVGKGFKPRQNHDVMDKDWNVSRVTRENKDKAWKQLGTSGSGNHFVEFGIVTLDVRDDDLGLDAGTYVALLSHSGSRGTGAAVCSTYSGIARRMLPKRHEGFGRLAWLDLDSDEGQDYWAAMNLMGDYASANHAVVHRNVLKLLGAHAIAGVENHHNFAWKEVHNGREVIVHRKGATPASEGELGVIPGSMRDPAFIVRGKGNAESLNSASHGAGRQMSRTQGKATFNFRAVQKDLEKKGIHVLSAGADEVPGVYKNILDVMHEQQDLIQTVARFDPRIVKMCGDG